MQIKKLNIYATALHLLLIALAIQVVVLVRDNRSLRIPQEQGASMLKTGDPFAEVPVLDSNGHDATLSFDSRDRETLLLVFTTTCPTCKANTPTWRTLYQRFHRAYDIVGISVDSLEATTRYITDFDLPYPVVIPVDRSNFPRNYRVHAVPHTIHLDRNGKVKSAWLGPLPEEAFKTLES